LREIFGAPKIPAIQILLNPPSRKEEVLGEGSEANEPFKFLPVGR
jgi:hypothetical protein